MCDCRSGHRPAEHVEAGARSRSLRSQYAREGLRDSGFCVTGAMCVCPPRLLLLGSRRCRCSTVSRTPRVCRAGRVCAEKADLRMSVSARSTWSTSGPFCRARPGCVCDTWCLVRRRRTTTTSSRRVHSAGRVRDRIRGSFSPGPRSTESMAPHATVLVALRRQSSF
eukprot:2346166-Prymnesium_polylepis.1